MTAVSYSAGFLRSLDEAGSTLEQFHEAGAAFHERLKDRPTFEVQIDGDIDDLQAALKAAGFGYRIRGCQADWGDG
jgi:hypothetical protein